MLRGDTGRETAIAAGVGGVDHDPAAGDQVHGAVGLSLLDDHLFGDPRFASALFEGAIELSGTNGPGILLVADGDAAQPAADLTKSLVGAASENGLVLLSCGVNGNVIRFLPPLTICDAVIDEGLDVVEACLGKLV